MSVMLKTVLSQDSHQFLGTKEMIEQAINDSKQRKDNTLLMEIMKAAFPSSRNNETYVKIGLDFATAYPSQAYKLLKRFSKLNPRPEFPHTFSFHPEQVNFKRQQAMRQTLAKAFSVMQERGLPLPKTSFSISDGDGNSVMLNTTAMRLSYPPLMQLAKTKSHFKTISDEISRTSPTSISSEILYPTSPLESASLAKPEAKDSLTAAISYTSNPKYTLSPELFPFLGRNALKNLLSYIGIPGFTLDKVNVSVSEYLQMMAAARMIGDESIVSRDIFTDLKICIRHSANYYDKNESSDSKRPQLCQNPLHSPPQLITNEDITLLTLILWASEHITGQKSVDGEIDVLSKETADNLDKLLPFFACFSENEKELKNLFLQYIWIPPSQMMDLCKNAVFFEIIKKCPDFLRVLIRRSTTKDGLDWMCMQANQELRNLPWKVVETDI